MADFFTLVVLGLVFFTALLLGLIVLLSNFDFFRGSGYYQNRIHSYAAGTISITVGLTYLMLF